MTAYEGFHMFQINQFLKLNFPGKTGKEIPVARSGHRAIADDDGHIYIIGGYNSEIIFEEEYFLDNDNFPLFREFWKLNLSTNEWNMIKVDENMPQEMASHSAILQNNYLLVFGGTAFPFGERSSNQLTACHLNSGKWKSITTSGTKPDKIYGQATACIKSHLYVYGGTTGFVYNTELHRLDLNNFVWEKLKPNNSFNSVPPERYRHEMACYENCIYVFGGGTSQLVCPLDKIYIYCIEKNTWLLKVTKPDQRTNSFPAPRRCHSCVQLDNKAYICGGYDGDIIHGDLWKFDLKTLQWTRLATMPEPVYFHSAAVTAEGCMVVFGGISCINTSERTNSCYQIWLKIPTLQTMCWLTLIRARPQLLKLSRTELLQLGINELFIEKLCRAEGA